jgi:hypothetical protein
LSEQRLRSRPKLLAAVTHLPPGPSLCKALTNSSSSFGFVSIVTSPGQLQLHIRVRQWSSSLRAASLTALYTLQRKKVTPGPTHQAVSLKLKYTQSLLLPFKEADADDHLLGGTFWLRASDLAPDLLMRLIASHGSALDVSYSGKPPLCETKRPIAGCLPPFGMACLSRNKVGL